LLSNEAEGLNNEAPAVLSSVAVPPLRIITWQRETPRVKIGLVSAHFYARTRMETTEISCHPKYDSMYPAFFYRRLSSQPGVAGGACTRDVIAASICGTTALEPENLYASAAKSLPVGRPGEAHDLAQACLLLMPDLAPVRLS